MAHCHVGTDDPAMRQIVAAFKRVPPWAGIALVLVRPNGAVAVSV